MFRIGMLTSGGDCQALNAAMRGVVKGLCSKRNDVEIYGFQDGYKVFLLPEGHSVHELAFLLTSSLFYFPRFLPLYHFLPDFL